AHDIAEEDLRAANNNIELRSGRILRIPPPQRIVAMEPEALTALRAAASAPVEPVVTDPVREEAPMVETAAAAANQPMLVRPQVTRGDSAPPPPVAPETAARSAAPAMSGSYTVKSGDTLWRISQNH